MGAEGFADWLWKQTTPRRKSSAQVNSGPFKLFLVPKEGTVLGVNPYIAFKGHCREAIDFYRSALDAEVLFTQTVGDSPMSNMGPPENIMHCSIKVGDSIIMMCDDPRPDASSAGGNISLAIGVNDTGRARRLFDNLASGGSVVMPLQKTYWAEAFGMLTDKFGVKWMINCEAPH
jgi:PhnB protein